MSTLEIQGLTAWYAPSHPVLRDCTFSLAAHEVVGLIGLNGAGKTTLLNVLSGLHPDYSVIRAAWGGTLSDFRDHAFKQARYTVFAEDAAFGYFSFREYLAFVSRAYGVSLPETDALVAGFHFEDYTDVPIRELSTGNRKKAFLISAFALRPPLLLLDEPVNGLDFQSTEFLYQCMNDYRGTGTLLFASHVLESITLTCERVLVLKEGHICRTFTAEEIGAAAIREALGHDDI